MPGPGGVFFLFASGLSNPLSSSFRPESVSTKDEELEGISILAVFFSFILVLIIIFYIWLCSDILVGVLLCTLNGDC
ncbi:hypothetical protein SUGI_0503060 [Cryptomeria japonica]|nr:hypothetical protein SUGI_0503060 [Cryptomeria japonica]